MMRVRTTVLAVVLCLAAVAVAGAATTPTPAAAPLPAFCAAATSAPQLGLPATPLPPFFAATTLCGTCSDSHCQGHNVGSTCSIPGPGGGLGHCYTNDMCSDSTWQCQCQKGAQ